MSQNNRKTLQQYVRGQIVQQYPPPVQNPFFDSLMVDENEEQQHCPDFFESLIQENNAIVEDYQNYEQKHKQSSRQRFNVQNLMASQSDNNGMPSRNSSLSSRENNLDFNNRSLEKFQMPLHKKYSDDFMMDENMEQRHGYNIIPRIYKPHLDQQSQRSSVKVQIKQREKNQKINKIRQVGCNCKKSKCLKMYCQCFHLQIFCTENCNCVDCGNMEPNSNHQQAVIDALTRNPKAFIQQEPKVEKSFKLGVGLQQVRKGCKCKKTKCLKKYCQCFSSGGKCGIFCKCQNCQNN